MTARRFYRCRLPHLRLEGGTYLVTWRLKRGQPLLWPDERSAVMEVLRRFDRTRFLHHACVVMDDHVHLVTTPLHGRSLERLVQAWKAFAARRLLAFGRTAPIWQREYHDRLILGKPGFDRAVRYVAMNPIRRWPSIDSYPWIWIAEAGNA